MVPRGTLLNVRDGLLKLTAAPGSVAVPVKETTTGLNPWTLTVKLPVYVCTAVGAKTISYVINCPLTIVNGAHPASNLNPEGPKLKLLMFSWLLQLLVTTMSCTRLWVLIALVGKVMLDGVTLRQLCAAAGATRISPTMKQPNPSSNQLERENIFSPFQQWKIRLVQQS